MAIDNNGYSSAFNMFVKFAEHRHGFDFDDAASKVSVMQSKDGERVRVISGASVTSAS